MTASPARDTRRLPLTGSTFIRALAALDDAPAPAAPDAFAQRLAQWLAWTDAFSLSAALGDGASRADAPRFGGEAALAADEREFARAKAALAKAAADAPDGSAPRRLDRARPRAAQPIEMPTDFATYRQRYAQCQLAMETQIVPLRRRLRATLADRSAAGAQLAELDTVMEQVVGTQERALLATVAGRLQARFDQLRGAGEDVPAGPWLDRFREEMRGLLLAELDLRLQPCAGLLEAARKSLIRS